jgi:competence ComEA-like helix-hairpin-helix protein
MQAFTRSNEGYRRTVWKGWVGPFLLLSIFSMALPIKLLNASPTQGIPIAGPAEPSPNRLPRTTLTQPTSTSKININTATQAQLETLPEIGPAKAKAIIAGRPYKTPEDIMKVKGIKQGTYHKIKEFITVQ